MKIITTWTDDNAAPERSLTSERLTDTEYHSLLDAWRSAGPDERLEIPTRVAPDGPLLLCGWVLRASWVRSIQEVD